MRGRVFALKRESLQKKSGVLSVIHLVVAGALDHRGQLIPNAKI